MITPPPPLVPACIALQSALTFATARRSASTGTITIAACTRTAPAPAPAPTTHSRLSSAGHPACRSLPSSQPPRHALGPARTHPGTPEHVPAPALDPGVNPVSREAASSSPPDRLRAGRRTLNGSRPGVFLRSFPHHRPADGRPCHRRNTSSPTQGVPAPLVPRSRTKPPSFRRLHPPTVTKGSMSFKQESNGNPPPDVLRCTLDLAPAAPPDGRKPAFSLSGLRRTPLPRSAPVHSPHTNPPPLRRSRPPFAAGWNPGRYASVQGRPRRSRPPPGTRLCSCLGSALVFPAIPGHAIAAPPPGSAARGDSMTNGRAPLQASHRRHSRSSRLGRSARDVAWRLLVSIRLHSASP
jgi:hypothetical protein